MHKSGWLIASAVLLACGGLAACTTSSRGAHRPGIEVTVVNSNKSDVMIDGCQQCKPVRVEGCRNPTCLAPKPGQDPSGDYVGWTEMRKLPRQYRLVLLRPDEPLNCPPATGRPANIPSSAPYTVVYDITPSGRCIIAGHDPVD